MSELRFSKLSEDEICDILEDFLSCISNKMKDLTPEMDGYEAFLYEVDLLKSVIDNFYKLFEHFRRELKNEIKQ